MSDPLDRAIFGDDRGAEAISRRQRRRAPRPPAKRTGRKVLVLKAHNKIKDQGRSKGRGRRLSRRSLIQIRKCENMEM